MAGTSYDGQLLKQAFKAAEETVEHSIEELNTLNVYPVPDGDTGNNMFLTLQSANEAIKDNDSKSATEICDQFSMGAMLGARGNSGVILSQILRGLAKGMKGKDSFTVSDFSEALRSASNTAYKAITDPEEGTILTVIKEASESAILKAENGANLEDLIIAVTLQAEDTVIRTPEMLPVLKEAGVVDAGGKGLYYLFCGMKECITKKLNGKKPGEKAKTRRMEERKISYGFDVQFLMEGEDMPIDEIRKNVESMGESVLVVGDETLIRVHIHTHTPDKVLSYCSSKGTLQDIINDNMDDQVDNFKKRHLSLQQSSGGNGKKPHGSKTGIHAG